MNLSGLRTPCVLAFGVLALGLSAANAGPAAEPGAAAPAFTGSTSKGERVSLSDFDGQTVILEWTNDGCPFVQKHYADPPRNMQGLQEAARAENVVWLQIISSAPGKQGHVDGAAADAINDARDARPTHVILDPEGDIGRMYDAKTTPQMFVITKDGTIAYAGAIDSIRSARVEDISKAENYVSAALDSVSSGKPVAVPSSVPYGCSVKY